MADKPIRGKVAAIITPRSVAITKGSDEGVTADMRFLVLLSLGPIKDPDDPERVLLADLSYTKGTLKTTQVFEKVSICEIEVTARTYLFPSMEAIRRLAGEPVDVRPRTDKPMASEEEFAIKVGDTVIQILQGADQG